jgi:DNA-binding transcriptional LysR family regulator
VELRLSDSPPDASNRADLAIHIGELKDGAGIVAKLAPNDRIVCASPELLAAHGTPQSAADLGRFPCIALRENEEDSTLWRFSHAGEVVSVRIRPTLASNDGEIIRLWALAGRGVIVRSEWNVADDLRDGSLVRVLHDFEPPPANVVALLGPTRARLARTQSFLDYVRRALHPAPWRAKGGA